MVYPIGDGNSIMFNTACVECTCINLMVYPIGDGNAEVLINTFFYSINLMVYPIGDGNNIRDIIFLYKPLINLMVYPIGDGNLRGMLLYNCRVQKLTLWFTP